MPDYRLYKSEKLCSRTAIDRLFAGGTSVKAYPLRAVFALSGHGESEKAAARFMITVPKKRIRKAVERVLLRRRIREAYRLNRALLVPSLERGGRKAEIAFVYLSDKIKDYTLIEEQMRQILQTIASATEAAGVNTTDNDATH